MRLSLSLAAVFLAILGGPGMSVSLQGREQQPSSSGSTATPSAGPSRALLDKYCVSCHSAKLKTGSLILENLNLADVATNAPILEKVISKLQVDQMPPPGMPRPDQATKRAFIASVESAIDKAAAATPNPGNVAAHRMSRLEYVNVIRDLLEMEIDGAAMLPADSAGAGFDNDYDVLKITPALMARYMTAAAKISRLAIGGADQSIRFVHQVPEVLRQDARMSDDHPFGTYGGTSFRYTFPADGEYSFKLRLQRTDSFGPIRGLNYDVGVETRIDRELVRHFRIDAKWPGADTATLVAPPDDDIESNERHRFRLTADDGFEFRVPVKAGTHVVSAAFTDAFELFESLSRGTIRRGQGGDEDAPGIDTIEIVGPHVSPGPKETEARRKIFVCRPASPKDEDVCADRVIRTLANRAYRRQVTAAEMRGLLALYRDARGEGSFDDGIERALEALLVSPNFLMKAEQRSVTAKAGTVARVSSVDLASRLSFFLWGSIPDDTLLSLARRGALSDTALLEQQVRRMLADPRATTFINNFSSQWLITRNATTAKLDPSRFPNFDANLQGAVVRELELFMESQVREDRSVLDLLRADYTFLNERLAKHYDIPNVYGNHFRRVTLTDERRFGLLGKGAVHLVSAYADRTSVVLRGKWILEYLLNAPPPPPPPNVPNLKDNDASKPTTLRERMEQHRANPVCASCHKAMDPLGFALENFDAAGRWRTTDNGVPVDAKSALPDGTTIDGVSGLRNFLVEKRGEVFARTVTRKLLAYASRRGTEYYDMPVVRQIMREAARDDYRWSSLIVQIVQSAPFQMRQLPGGATPVLTAVAERR